MFEEGKEILKGMDEKEIRIWAKEYDPTLYVSKNGSTISDIRKGDLIGRNQRIRKAAHEWVKEHDAKIKIEEDSKKADDMNNMDFVSAKLEELFGE